MIDVIKNQRFVHLRTFPLNYEISQDGIVRQRTNSVFRSLILCSYRCFYCDKGLNAHKWHLDHFIPMSKGGKNEFENLRPACIECNLMKSDMFYEHFVKKCHRITQIFLQHNPDHIFSKENYKSQTVIPFT